VYVDIGPGNSVISSLDHFIIKNGQVASGSGGGIANTGNLTVTNSLIQDNFASGGGGISNSHNSSLTLSNVTISNNFSAMGGGIWNNGGTLILNNTTITGNSATMGMGAGIRASYAVTNLRNSIVAGNVGEDCSSDNSQTVFTSQGYNLIGNNINCPFTATTGDKVGTNTDPINPRLTPLQDNGGPTFTHALLAGSPAIDAGNPATPGGGGNGCLATDQRGVSRPVGPRCDIGSYEYNAPGISSSTGTPQISGINTAFPSPLKVFVIDNSNTAVNNAVVTFTAPSIGASVVFASTGTNISTTTTDANGIATSSTFSANNVGGYYVIQATVTGVGGSADFQITNIGDVRTYTANNTATLPGSFLCDQTQPNCTNWSNSNFHADEAHKYAIGTYNFYATNFLRDSIDNNNIPIISSVHYCSPSFVCPYANAFWSGEQMVYGDAYGFPLADDVVAHELTHGVTQYESNLFYYYQSGAINESLSDVFGEYYDQTNGQGNDDPSFKWRIGEDVLGLGILRSMINPPYYGDPDKMTSSYYSKDADDNGGVHSNSGVNNKAVYLMVEGNTFNGITVTGIGWKKIGVIYYEVNTNLLTSGSDYSDLYYAVQQACANLTGQLGITSGDCLQVKNALDAVEMNSQPIANYNPDAPVCEADASVIPLFQDNMEGGTGKWAMTGAWSLQTGYASSSIHMLYGDDFYPSSDSSATMATGVPLPVASNMFLHFKHAFAFEYFVNEYYDGGVLEYSINNGSSWVDASPLFAGGQNYTGPILNYNGTTNALKGRNAFVGDSHGYVSSRYDLTSLGGQTIKFRWRFATDNSYYYLGWMVDDVQIYSCDALPPSVSSILHANFNPNNLASVQYTVNFSKSVTGVDISDFSLTTSGVSGAAMSGISGSGSVYTVTVNTGSGDGSIRLNLVDDNSIIDASSRPLGGAGIGDGSFTNGEPYTITKSLAGVTAGVFRPGNGLLYLKNAHISGFADVAINYGTGGDYPIAGDWDGNGTATIGIYRNGSFYLRNSNTLGFADNVFAFGTPGDQPVAGDWDGDGVDTIGVYRNGLFLLRNNNSEGPADMSFYLGNPGDVGIAGDWDGDSMGDTTGVFRPSNGIIFLKNANTTGFADIALNYGLAGDMPVTGDWNNDGIDTIGVYRNAQFYLRNSNTIGFAEIVFALGNPGDMPIAGNWDGLP
jgi:Zn-dependent metalloprotease